MKRASLISRTLLFFGLGVLASKSLTLALSIGPHLQQNGDDFSLLAPESRRLRNPCLDESAQREEPEFCCLEHGVGCNKDIVPQDSCSMETLQPGQTAYCCTEYGVSCPTLGAACSENLPCEEGSCVYSQLLLTRAATCESISSERATCSLDYCILSGADAICTIGDIDSDVTTCGAWHTYLTTGGTKLCSMPCTRECLPKSMRPIASNGRAFCTVCQLKSVSCNSGFAVFGPIQDDEPEHSSELEVENSEDQKRFRFETEPNISPVPEFEEASPEELGDSENETTGLDSAFLCNSPKISPVMSIECCQKFNIGCLKIGDTCSPIGSRVPQVACEEHLKCVISNFASPATDSPMTGTCQDIGGTLVTCSVDFCARSGTQSTCNTPDDDQVTTCGAWASRSDGGETPNCVFACTLECNIGPTAPVGSDGKRYCSECQLRGASCASNFEIYGPVPHM